MSVSTPKRLFLSIIAVLIGTSAFASHPSPRAYGRLAYDSEHRVAVLFGGRGRLDPALGFLYDSAETWLWTGSGWVQQFPLTSPPQRSAHTMVYDDLHDRVLMFGGRQEKSVVGGPETLLNDLWEWKDGNWTRIAAGSASGPSGREFPGVTRDEKRDVIVVFGGHEFQPLKPKQKNPDKGPVYDTWEFSDGAWTKMGGVAPKVARPLLAWDDVKEQIVMLGIDGTNAAPVMYRYDGEGSWTKETPAKLPTCVAEGYLMVKENGRLLHTGGVCPTGTPAGQEVFEYDGTTWNKLTIGAAARGVGQAVAYDTFRDRIIIYGGTTLNGVGPFANTLLLTDGGIWNNSPEVASTPLPRSWMVFESDPMDRGIVMYGGLSENGGVYGADSWHFANEEWGGSPGVSTAPPDCINPLNTIDTDRDRLIVLCSGNTVWEYDGATWKDFSTTDIPDERRFSGIAYDARLKKVVLFGGFFNNNYRNDTWTWDGTKWTELDIDNDDRPERRSSFVMWYDAAQQKTLLYGGVGRPNLNSKVTRFSDMWSFDGTRWTKMNVTKTPGVRFRPHVHLNPTNGKLLLFGGLRSEPVDDDSIRQFYGDDTWEWDGSTNTWTELQPEHRPAARQNGGMAWDPTTNEMILFGGWAYGFSYSDTWAWNGVDWRLIPETFLGPKRRSVR